MKTKYKITYISVVLVMTLTLMFVAVFAATNTTSTAEFNVTFTPAANVNATVTGGVYVGTSSIGFTRSVSGSTITHTASNGESYQTFSTLTIDTSTQNTLTINNISLGGKYDTATIVFNIINTQSSSVANPYLFIVPSASTFSPTIYYYSGSAYQTYTSGYGVQVSPSSNTSIMLKYTLADNTTYSGQSININLYAGKSGGTGLGFSGTHTVS